MISKKNRPPAQYRCLRCEHKWEVVFDFTIPMYVHPSGCPECGNLWFKWENYEDIYGKASDKTNFKVKKN